MKPAEPAVTVYGIANCDTVKKARAWLAERGIDGVFHDYKKLGVPLASRDFHASMNASQCGSVSNSRTARR